MRTGPLVGVTVIEIQGLGPGSFAGMILADLGATVTAVGRADAEPTNLGALTRGKRHIGVDLKDHDGLAELLALIDSADVLIDVFRPGVAERLGFGPDVCATRNPRLVFARLTGFGQDGPWAQKAGHDLTYLALCGALEPLGRADGPPTAPINVLADFAGGGMLCAMGVMAALYERERSGLGQVVDAAMVDGAAMLMSPFYAGRTNQGWGPRGTNLLDGAAPFYDTYRCSDGRWLSVGALEPQFYARLVEGLGLAGSEPLGAQYDESDWPARRHRFAAVIATRTRDEWCEVFEHLDACVEPALTPDEAPLHPHAVARRSFITDPTGLPQPAPAPRFSRTPGSVIEPA